MFPYSNLPNCILNSDFLVNDHAFLLLPFCKGSQIAERHACPSKALSCLLDHDQHFVEKMEDFLQPSGILLLFDWLQFFEGKSTEKMDSWFGDLPN